MTLEGEAVILPVGRGVQFVDKDEQHVEDLIEELNGGPGEGYLRLTVEWVPAPE